VSSVLTSDSLADIATQGLFPFAFRLVLPGPRQPEIVIGAINALNVDFIFFD